MSYENHKYNNHIIESLTREHGTKVIEWWKSQGIDTGNYSGKHCRLDNDEERYYGLLNGYFGNYSADSMKKCIYTLMSDIPPSNSTFSVGQIVKFITKYDVVPCYKTEDLGILLKHGNTKFKENKGKIEGVLQDNRVAVSFYDIYDKTVCLSFSVNDIEPYEDNKTTQRKGLEGIFIEVLDEEHGTKVIDFIISQGYETQYEGSCNRENNDRNRFYGVSFKGKVDHHSKEYCEHQGYGIMTLEELIGNTKNFNNNTKTENHGTSKTIKVQRVTPTIQSGIRIGGSSISGRRSKASIAVGHLSNTKVVGI